MSLALVDALRALPDAERRRILGSLSARQLAALRYEWRRFWARPDQLVPEAPHTFFAQVGGRGSGKTRSVGEAVCERVRIGKARRIHLLGATYEDVAETMIEGDSGIMACSPPSERPKFFSSKAGGILVWPNGARGRAFSVEEPRRLRGPQCDTVWADDLAAWGAGAEDAWMNAMHGLRLGDPWCGISSTPAALPLLRSLIQDRRRGMILVESITDDNRANLPESFFLDVLAEFEGTQLEQQERYGRLVEEIEGALFFEKHFRRVAAPPDLVRIVVAVDPALTTEDYSDETGIVVLGLGADETLYVLADFTGPHLPEKWAEIAVKAFRDYQADVLVAEENAGWNLVRRNLEVEAKGLPIKAVNVKRGKALRAEPLSSYYARGRVAHVKDGPGIARRLHRRASTATKRRAEYLESELVAWVPSKSRSPNGIDALVAGAAELLGDAWATPTVATPAPTLEELDPYRYTGADPDDVYRYSAAG